MDTNHLQRLDAAILEALNQAEAERAALETLALDLAKAPDDAGTLAALEEVDKSSAATKRRLNYLQQARTAAAAADGVNLRAEVRETRKKTRRRIDKLMGELRQEHDALLQQVHQLAGPLATYAAKVEDLRDLAFQYVRPAEQGKPWRVSSMSMVVQDLIMRGPAAPLLRAALWDAGVGRTAGLQLDLALGPYDGRETLADHQERIKRILDDAQQQVDEADRVVGDAIDPPPVPEMVPVVATERAFVGGVMVEPGQTTYVMKGQEPKWAAPAGTKSLPAAKGGDTKPLDAQKAVADKAARTVHAMHNPGSTFYNPLASERLR